MNAALKYRDALIVDYQEYAQKIANKIRGKYNLPLELLEDMESAAMLGLVEAAERFDVNRGINFHNYAFYRIKGSIFDFIRKNSDLSYTAYQALKSFEALNELQYDIAKRDRRKNKDKTSNDRTQLGKLLDLAAQGVLIFQVSHLKNSFDIPTEDQALIADRKKFIRHLISNLSEKERIVIESYYFEGLTFVEICSRLGGLSKSWVSRLHTQAIEKLKEAYLQYEN